jgi:hypothetical protein
MIRYQAGSEDTSRSAFHLRITLSRISLLLAVPAISYFETAAIGSVTSAAAYKRWRDSFHEQ